MVIATRTQMLLVTPDGESIADSYALQGTWTPEQYLRITNDSNRLLEFTDGALEMLPPPMDKHQNI